MIYFSANQIIILLIILWALGFLGGFVGDVIHLLLVAIVVVYVLRFLGIML